MMPAKAKQTANCALWKYQEEDLASSNNKTNLIKQVQQ